MPERSQFIEIVLMWVLFGLLPLLISLSAATFALQHGAREWPGYTFEAVFTVLYFACMIGGAYLWSGWFNNSR